jgi:hypothetical protein
MKITKETKVADIVLHVTSDLRLVQDEDTGEVRPPTWGERVSAAVARLHAVWGGYVSLVQFRGEETIEEALKRKHQGAEWIDLVAAEKAQELERYVAAWDLFVSMPSSSRNLSVFDPAYCGAVIRGEAKAPARR